jgi:hypothetical protein
VKDLSTSCVLAFAFVHRFAFAFVHRFALSTRIRGSEDCELVTLGSLDPRRCSCDLLWSTPFVASGAFCGGARPFVAAWELPILLWVVPQVCCKGLDFRPKGNQ